MKNNKIFLLLFIYSVAAALTIIYFDGTGDAGDSINHFQFAKFAPIHPDHFFNHWAKPLYVLLASPFAQFGFIGVKIFNAIVSLLTIFYTYKIAQKLNVNNAIIGPIILMFSPLFFVLTFSGLTEPLFALFICMGLYAILMDRIIVSCLIISFLPFIRSEGLIIIGAFAFYFLLKGKWKLIPFFLFGHVVYSLAGYFVHGDLFWVLNKIPYATLSSPYGSGKLSHFVEQLIYVVGVPIYILFWIGVLSIFYKSIKSKVSLEIQILVLTGFFSFFIAHSLFWYLGIFNSMGLKRVFIGVAPLISIISLIGFNFLTDEILKNKRIPRLIVQSLLVGYILIFPFTNNPAAIDWERDLKLSKDQQSAVQVADFISKNRDSSQSFVFAHPYLSLALDIDHFDDTKRYELNLDYMNHLKSGDIVIWENWFALVANSVTKKSLDTNQELTCIYNISVYDRDREILYAVYKKK